MENKDTIKQLTEKYPFLKAYNAFTDEAYDDTTWQESLDPGWQKAFCPQIWDELKAILEKYDRVNGFRFDDIKEKYAELRMYYHIGNGNNQRKLSDEEYMAMMNEINAWEDRWADKSTEVCIRCGKPAEVFTLGWYMYMCKDCANKEHRAYNTLEEPRKKEENL